MPLKACAISHVRADKAQGLNRSVINMIHIALIFNEAVR